MDSELDSALSSGGKGSINGSRKESFYRRVSFHHFHVVQDQMACCCCVPLGMALHIVAGLDVIFMISLIIQGFEYMIMVDLDDVIATFKPSQIKYLFEHTEWDALFANCLGKYYDIWALRIERDKWTQLCPFQVIDYDCWEAVQKYRTRQVVSQHQISIPVSTPLIPVNSAFGGFGIYKVDKINGRYNGFDGRIRCEHVEFHKGMKRLFICPKFLVNKQSEHIA
jgi:hypothetical protein